MLPLARRTIPQSHPGKMYYFSAATGETTVSRRTARLANQIAKRPNAPNAVFGCPRGCGRGPDGGSRGRAGSTPARCRLARVCAGVVPLPLLRRARREARALGAELA